MKLTAGVPNVREFQWAPEAPGPEWELLLEEDCVTYVRRLWERSLGHGARLDDAVPAGSVPMSGQKLSQRVWAAIRSRSLNDPNDAEAELLAGEVRGLEAELTHLRGHLHIPGTWVCPTCGFLLKKCFLHAQNGAVAVNDADESELCPNDGAPLRRVTWKEECKKSLEAP